MNTNNHITLAQTERDYNRARTQAFWSEIWARLRGQSMDLLSFDDVKQKLKLHDERHLGLKDIPLDNIVGSVGRYKDFNRKFLPKKNINKDRWKAVAALTLGLEGYPPIEVYKVGEAYFVLDGNHRVSVARANGLKTIEAYVTEFKTNVPFDQHTTPDELFIKEGYADFLRKTGLNLIRPGSQVILTEPGRYQHILQHIQVHHYFQGLDCECPITWDEAVASWYDHVYMPMVRAIQQHAMLADFPERTEADMYVWLIKHQGDLREHYGGDPLSPEATIDDFLTKLKA